MLNSATNVERSIKLLIEHQCPQCGAPTTLEETDRLFRCGFCRVKSYLLAEDYFRYIFPSKTALDQELIYFPYWRFKGMTYACLPNGIKHRFSDVSYQAVDEMHMPLSVGLRSQALKLNFVTPETKGYFLTPTVTYPQALAKVAKRMNSFLPKSLLHLAHVGETFSMLYAPYYVKRGLYDAIVDKPLASQPPPDFDLTSMPGGQATGGIQFLPTLCPDCGWDLEGERDSLVLNCRNCDSVWKPSRKGLKKLAVAHMAVPDADAIYLPFWRIEAEIKGFELNNYTDLVKLANLPKVVQNHQAEDPFYFWGLAFKVRPQNYLNLSTRMTLAQPAGELKTQPPPQRVHPVNLPLQEAIETMKLTLANFVKPRKLVTDRLPDVEILPNKFLLVYIPFVEKPHELVHPSLHLAINKNQLKLANNL